MGKITDGLFKAGLFIKDNAPDIEMCASGGFAILGGVSFCIFAPEIAAVTEKLQKMAEDGESKVKIAKEAIKGYTKYAGIGFGCEVASIVLACESKATVESRLNAVAASLEAVAASFAAYRGRVVEDVGEEKDFYYYTGEELQKETSTSEDGTCTTTASKLVPSTELANKLKEGEVVIPHSFVFDSTNPNWNGNKEADENFLYNGLAAANRQLSYRGYIFENKIFDCFSADETVRGQAAGALRDWEDGTVEHKLRFNPVWLQPFLNGERNWCVCEIEYDDGTKLDDNILIYADKIGLR